VSEFTKTSVPCVYHRGHRFYVKWYADHRRRWASFSTFEAALAFKRKMVDSDSIEARIVEANQAVRVRQRADLTDAYAFVRQALQCLDRAKPPRSVGDPIYSALYAAEAALSEQARLRASWEVAA
jgi:hypothetical protein